MSTVKEPIEHEQFDDDEGLCECGKTSWETCDCGEFFLNWICEYDPATGQCGLAGSEDCDWECPRGGLA